MAFGTKLRVVRRTVVVILGAHTRPVIVGNKPIHPSTLSLVHTRRVCVCSCSNKHPSQTTPCSLVHVLRPSRITARTSFPVGSQGRFSFSIPGIRFQLFVAETFSDQDKRKTFVQVPERIVLVGDDIEDDVAESYAHLYNNATPKGVLAKRFSDPKEGVV